MAWTTQIHTSALKWLSAWFLQLIQDILASLLDFHRFWLPTQISCSLSVRKTFFFFFSSQVGYEFLLHHFVFLVWFFTYIYKRMCVNMYIYVYMCIHKCFVHRQEEQACTCIYVLILLRFWVFFTCYISLGNRKKMTPFTSSLIVLLSFILLLLLFLGPAIVSQWSEISCLSVHFE